MNKDDKMAAARLLAIMYPAMNGNAAHGGVFSTVTGGHSQFSAQNSNDIDCNFDTQMLTQYLNTCPQGSAEELLFGNISNIEVSRSFEYESMDSKSYTEIDDSEMVGVCAPFKMISCDKGQTQNGKTLLKGLAKCIDATVEDNVDRAIQLAVIDLRERLSRIDLVKVYMQALAAATKKKVKVIKGMDLDCVIEDLVDDMDCPANTFAYGKGFKKLRKKLYGQPDLSNKMEDKRDYSDAEIAESVGVERAYREMFKYKAGDKAAQSLLLDMDGLLFNSGQRVVSPDGLEYNPVSFARFWTPVGTDRTPGESIEGGRWGVNVKPGPRAKSVIVEVFAYSQLSVINTSNLAHISLTDGIV